MLRGLTGEVDAVFVMGGMSKEKNNPYLQVSDGIEASFVRFDKECEIDKDTFANYQKGDEITLEVFRPLFGNDIYVKAILE